jgi:2-C-methyl-D-erythritol 4-phosphate cytidylyltransferase
MVENKSVAAIIVAAGKGLRMNMAQKKQYITLGSLPVLSHTLSSFDSCDVIEAIFLVIPKKDRSLCQRDILEPLDICKPVHVVSGGATRQESVLNGLKATEGKFQFVAIHDGVRPLVKPEKIKECVLVGKKFGACILAVPASDTVKTIDKKNCVVSTVERQKVRIAQTPQVFSYEDILEAHLAARRNGYVATDDAELLENQGGIVKVIAGDPVNIKITTREDLKIAQTLLENTQIGTFPNLEGELV